MNPDEKATVLRRHLDALDRIEQETRKVLDHGGDAGQILQASRMWASALDSRARLLGLYPPHRMEVVVVPRFEPRELPPSLASRHEMREIDEEIAKLAAEIEGERRDDLPPDETQC